MATRNQQGKGSRFAAGLLLGSILGGAIALWFAPKSGKQTQAYLFKQWVRLRKQANRSGNELYHNAQKMTSQALEEADRLQQEGLSYLQDQGEQLQNQLGTAKTKLKQMAS